MSKSITFQGKENLPSEIALIVPNRLNHDEAIELGNQFSGRKIIWLCEENVVLPKKTETHLSQSNATAIVFSAEDEGITSIGERLLKDLGDDGVAIFLPGNVNAINGATTHIAADTLKALCSLGIPVTPVACHRAEETRLSTSSNSEKNAILAIEPLIDAKKLTSAKWMQAILLGGERAFSARPFLRESLGYHLIKGLKLHSKNKIVDGTNDQERTYGVVLGIALAFAKHIKETTKQKRVGIILPPGTGGLIANLAVIFAGKIPVNINFTASESAIKSSMRQADVDKYITADPFVRKLSDFPWPPLRDLIHVERLLPNMKKSIKRWVILSKFLSPNLLCKVAGIDKKGGDREAILLFTSGSSGEPKGVPLSHRNVLANVCQFSTRLDLPERTSVLGCLPLFHSFGCTVTLWFPVIEGVDLVTYPSPLETKRLAELIEKNKVNFLICTPTFLRGYMRRVKPEQLASIKLVVTGAEKLPLSLGQKFHEKFGIYPQEGYGLTETSPATNVNIPTEKTDSSEPDISASKTGTVGQFLPGIAAKVTDASTDEEKDIDQSGIIWLRGANIFKGYLNNQEKTDEVIIDDWFKTGDVGKIDSEGFLHIEGRISRFSKIGGEMVPHETLEAAITKVLNLDSETERKIAVVGVPDEKKGESIILLSCISGDTPGQEVIDLRYKLLDAGIPSLWCPKDIYAVDEIPILASGKLDIKGCEELVKSLL